MCQYGAVKGDPEIDERENMAYGARPYLENPPPPAPRDLTKLVYLNETPPQSGVDEDPEDLR